VLYFALLCMLDARMSIMRISLLSQYKLQGREIEQHSNMNVSIAQCEKNLGWKEKKVKNTLYGMCKDDGRKMR